MPQCWWSKLCGLFEHCLKSVWTSQHACTAVQTVCKHFSWQYKLFGVLLKHCSNFSECTCCCLNIACCSVQTCYTFFSMCLNSVQTACHAVVCCSNTFRTVCSCLAMFEHCSKCLNITCCFACCPNTVRTVFGHVIHSFPCV